MSQDILYGTKRVLLTMPDRPALFANEITTVFDALIVELELSYVRIGKTIIPASSIPTIGVVDRATLFDIPMSTNGNLALSHMRDRVKQFNHNQPKRLGD